MAHPRPPPAAAADRVATRPGSGEGDTVGTLRRCREHGDSGRLSPRRWPDQASRRDSSGIWRGCFPGSFPPYTAAAITWLAISPALTVLLVLLGPVRAPVPLLLRTLVVTAVFVPIMVSLLVPGMQPLFTGWLSPRSYSSCTHLIRHNRFLGRSDWTDQRVGRS
jgi:hypothetical protein